MTADEQAEADMQDAFDEASYGVTHKQLDSIAEKDVRYELAKGKFGSPGGMSHDIVLSWLAFKDTERANENLSISRKALDISRSAPRRALIAIALSTTMAIYEIGKWLSTRY